MLKELVKKEKQKKPAPLITKPLCIPSILSFPDKKKVEEEEIEEKQSSFILNNEIASVQKNLSTKADSSRTLKQSKSCCDIRETFENNVVLMNELAHKVMVPIRKNKKKNNKCSEILTENVKNLSFHMDQANDNLKLLKIKKTKIKNEIKNNFTQTTQLKIQNNIFEEEIEKLRREVNDMNNKLIFHQKQKILYDNQTELNISEISEMKRRMKELIEENHEVDLTIRNIKRAIIKTEKESKALKIEITKKKEMNNIVGDELLCLYNKYK